MPIIKKVTIPTNVWIRSLKASVDLGNLHLNN